jgi:hypothetical protein
MRDQTELAICVVCFDGGNPAVTKTFPRVESRFTGVNFKAIALARQPRKA